MSYPSSIIGVLSLLDETNQDVPIIHNIYYTALQKINQYVDIFWYEIYDFISKLKILCDDNNFPHKNLAASVVSKVYYYIHDLPNSFIYSLKAKEYFNINDTSPYVQSLIKYSIDEYIHQEEQIFKGNMTIKRNDILESLVNNIIDKYTKNLDYHLAIGLSIDTKKFSKIIDIISNASNKEILIKYSLDICVDKITNNSIKVLLMKTIYESYNKSKLNENFLLFRILYALKDYKKIKDLLKSLLKNNDNMSKMTAFQIGFNIIESENHKLIYDIIRDFNSDENTELFGVEKKAMFNSIINGDYTSGMYLSFQHRENRLDPFVMRNILERNGDRYSIINNALIISYSISQCGTASDRFIRKNLSWFTKASNWAKFTAVSCFGVIHKGHINKSLKLLRSYLPKLGKSSSPYQESGSLFALGLINSINGSSHINYMINVLKSFNDNEIIQHGACLGLGLLSLSLANKNIANNFMDIISFDYPNSGDAAGISLGLNHMGHYDKDIIQNVLMYANETKHEKIIRSLIVGLSLICYESYEKSDSLIEKLIDNTDPIIRYGGCFVIGMSYVGTDNSQYLRKLLNIAATDSNGDVKRAALLNVAFILLRTPENVPIMLKLMAESFNSHCRYGASMAIGISCAGTGSKKAIEVLEPLLNDKVVYVKQAAMMAISMVLIQKNKVENKTITEVWDFLNQIIKSNTTNDFSNFVKMGAIISSGILSMGGNNCNISMVTPEGQLKMRSIAGIVIFLQYWYWFPYYHFLSLAINTTAYIGLNLNLDIPKYHILKSDVSYDVFDYLPNVKKKEKSEKKRLSKVKLSVSAKTKSKKNTTTKIEPLKSNVKSDIKNIQEKNNATSDTIINKKENEMISNIKAEDAEEKIKSLNFEDIWVNEKKMNTIRSTPKYTILGNFKRVTQDQSNHLCEFNDSRYSGIDKYKKKIGIHILRNKRPEKDEYVIKFGTSKDEPIVPDEFKIEREL